MFCIPSQDTGKWDAKWVLNPANNKCYLVGKNAITDGRYLGGNFTQAQDYCHEIGTELASIHSAEENSWLIPKLVGDIWIGLIMSSPTALPNAWVDGTSVDYTNWQEKYPSSKKGRLYVRVSVSIEPNKYGFWCNQEVAEYGHYPLCMTNAIRRVLKT